MSYLDNIDFENLDSIEKGITKTIENNNAEDIKKLRLLIEDKASSQKWIGEVFLPLSTREFFNDFDLSNLLYNIPHKILTTLASNYNSSQLLSRNGYTRPMITAITNIIETSNTNINVTMSMIDYLNNLYTKPDEDELVCRLQLHVLQEVLLNTIKRLEVVDFDFNQLMKVVVTSYLKFFIRISKSVKDPFFLLKRAFLFVRDFLPPKPIAEDEDALETIRALLPMFLFKAFEIVLTCKQSTNLLQPETRAEFKKIGSMYYQMALSFDIDFEQEIKNLEKDCQVFIDSFKENCKDKSDEEIQEYLYHLAVVQDSKPVNLRIDYKSLLYLALTNANEEDDAVEVNLTVLLISLFKINAFYTANDYNNPAILNGVITAKLLSIKDKEDINGIPEKVITQILQQLCFEGENGVIVVKHILKLMPYEYQIWYCLDTIQECPLAEIRGLFWKDVLNEVIKHNDRENWINVCNAADIEVLKYTETKHENEEEKISEKFVIDNMLKFLKKFKALENFEKSLNELIELYEQLDEIEESDEEKESNEIE
ncbi:Ybp1 protein [Hanseniaspora uvarum]|nr:Ybp1 protein [Hanseniaspora uvarum]